MKLNDRFMLLALALLAGGSLWLNMSNSESPQQQVEKPPVNIDSYMSKVRITATDSAGNLDYKLLADRIEHHVDDDNTHLFFPHFIQYRMQGSPLHMKASSGVLKKDNEQFLLHGAVTIQREASANEEGLQLTTRDLLIDTKNNIASSDQKTLITGKDWQLRATGMTINTDTGITELHHVIADYSNNS